VSFGNLRDLRRVLDRLYPVRKPPIWLTEMGYQTNPPDTLQGVSPAVQARYLRECVRIARRIPRVDMLIWFMLRDEEQGDRGVTAGFQTGLFWDSDLPKPSFYVFRALARGAR